MDHLTHSLMGTAGLEKYHFTPASSAYLNGRTKRILDVFGAVMGMILGMPVFLLAMLIVHMIDGVPAIFSQERFGMGGKPFVFYKLRTLRVIDPRETINIERLQYKPDYETTRTGRFWRVTSIDEIIQFWLVLKGDLSLIGHRPLPAYYIQHLDKLEGMTLDRLNHYLHMISSYKPGMSSLSSVNGRGNLTMQQKMEFDLIYAQQASFMLDISLLFRTLLVVMSRRGAR